MTGKTNWSLTCFQEFGGKSSAAIIHSDNGGIHVQAIKPSAAEAKDPLARPVFLTTTDDNRVAMMDAKTKKVSIKETIPADAFGIYYYPDADQDVFWCTIDGDDDTGADLLNCGENGAAVIIGSGKNANTRILNTLCLGRGHHVVAIVGSVKTPNRFPKKAFVSSLMEGTMTVIGNDPGDSKTYLRVLDTVNLCQPAKEKGGVTGTPNNAFPHGMVFSETTGKVYSLNNGYGNIIAMDPVTHKIEATYDMPVASNILLSPCGRFIVGKGADRKKDANHVIGRLAVLDVTTGKTETTLDVPDFYPSTFRFTPDGKKLYVSTASTGKGAQKDNLDNDSLYVYDTSKLPQLRLLKKIKVGKAECSRRPMAFLLQGQSAPLVFNPDPTDGTVTIIDSELDSVIKTVTVSEKNAVEVAFDYWRGGFYGT